MVSRFSILCSLFLICALQAQPLSSPDTGTPALPDSGHGGQPPMPDSVDVQQLDREIQQNQSDLEQTKQRLAEAGGRLNELDAREQAGLARVATLEEQVNLTRRYIRQLEDQAAARH